MDYLSYEYLLENLKLYNKSVSQNYGNTVVRVPPDSPKFPLTVFTEIRNVSTSFNTKYQKLSNVGYRVDIYAKTKNKVTNDEIARKVASIVDDYLTNVGLDRVSFNVFELADKEGSIFNIVMTYTGNLDENRRRMI